MQWLCCARPWSENKKWSSARILACPEDKNILVTAEEVGGELFQGGDGITETQGILIP